MVLLGRAATDDPMARLRRGLMTLVAVLALEGIAHLAVPQPHISVAVVVAASVRRDVGRYVPHLGLEVWGDVGRYVPHLRLEIWGDLGRYTASTPRDLGRSGEIHRI